MLIPESSLEIEIDLFLSSSGLCFDILDFPEFSLEKICFSFPEFSLETVSDFEEFSLECLEL